MCSRILDFGVSRKIMKKTNSIPDAASMRPRIIDAIGVLDPG